MLAFLFCVCLAAAAMCKTRVDLQQDYNLMVSRRFESHEPEPVIIKDKHFLFVVKIHLENFN